MMRCFWVTLLGNYLKRPLVVQMVKESTCNSGDLHSILGSGRSHGEGNRTHSSISAWEILWTEERGRLQSMGSQRVRHYWATITYLLEKRVGRDSKQERLQLWKYMLRCWQVDWKNDVDYSNRRSTWAYATKVASARLLSVSNVQPRRGECVV